MGFFDMFKKKDDFDSLLKDPLTNPLGANPLGQSQDPFAAQELQAPREGEIPSFDMPGMPKQDTGIDGFQSSLSSQNNQNNYQTSASQIPTPSQGFGQTYNNPRQSKGPESYEEMVLQQRQQPPIPQKAATQANEGLDRRDFEILNSKLDTIKSQLESITQRLSSFERKNYEEELPRQRRYNW